MRQFNFLNEEDGRKINDVYGRLCEKFDLEGEKSAMAMRGLIGKGIAYHHAGMLPTLKEAIERLFLVKKRRSENPVLILIPSEESLCRYVTSIPDIAHHLIRQFWPGGLTIIFQADPNIPALLTAGTGKIGVRLSSHPIATGLTRTAGVPITGTSANISGQPACVNALEVFHSLGKGVDIILNGGETKGAPGSTILDVTTTPPRIIREGMISSGQLNEFIPT